MSDPLASARAALVRSDLPIEKTCGLCAYSPNHSGPHWRTDLSPHLRDALAEYDLIKQTSAEPCPRCGWRFLVPGLGCMKCDGFDLVHHPEHP